MIELFNFKFINNVIHIEFDDDLAEYLLEQSFIDMGGIVETKDQYLEMYSLIDDYIRTECE